MISPLLLHLSLRPGWHETDVYNVVLLKTSEMYFVGSKVKWYVCLCTYTYNIFPKQINVIAIIFHGIKRNVVYASSLCFYARIFFFIYSQIKKNCLTQPIAMQLHCSRWQHTSVLHLTKGPIKLSLCLVCIFLITKFL